MLPLMPDDLHWLLCQATQAEHRRQNPVAVGIVEFAYGRKDVFQTRTGSEMNLTSNEKLRRALQSTVHRSPDGEESITQLDALTLVLFF